MTSATESLVDELVRRLAMDGEVTRSGSEILVHRLAELRFEEPVTIRADEAGVRAAVQISAETRDSLWPGWNSRTRASTC